MALVTVQRSPTPSASSSPSVSEGGSDDDRRLQQQSLSDSFFTVKGAALFLQQGNSSQVPRCYHHHKYAGDLQLHLQVMINHLRPEDRIKLAVRLESMSAHRVRYMVVVYTNGNQDTEENVLLGIDFASKESNTCTIGLTLPLWSDTKIHLDGDGGFSVSTVDRIHIFKPVSVQAMWSALQILHKSCEIARRYNYYPSGIALTWTSYYESCINSDQSCINEWNAMQDLQSMRADSPPMFVDKPTENELTERLIKNKLRYIMMSKDLENVTSKDIRNELEQQMNCTLKEYKGFIDNEMLIILGQMDKATLIFDHLYLGSEWNASNLEELQSTGVGYILNVTREVDNFFPGLFCYHNIRVFDEDATDLLAYWNDAYNFITKAKKDHSKCLVHCKMGISRSASTVIAYAMKEYRWSLEEAYKYVKEKRSVAQPNAGFMRQLAEYEGILDASKHRHNILWRRNSESGLQETVRDPMLQSSKASTPHDLNRCKAVIQHTCEEQKYNDAETSLNVAVTNKDEIEPVNFNYYFRCLSEPVTDSAYNRQQKELEQLSVQVDNVEKNEIQIDNEDFRCTEDSAHDTRMLASSQLQDSYDNKSRLLGQQGNTLKISTAVEEPEEENENTMNLDMHDQGDHFMVNGPNTENDAEAIANLKGMLEPDSTSSVESQLSKDNVNNNNNTTRNYLKEDEDLTTTETSNSIKPINKFALDCSDSVSNIMCERFMDRSKNLYQVQICSTCNKESQGTKSSGLGYLSSGASDVQMTEAFYSVPNETEMTEKPVNKIDAIYTTDTILLHETAETDVGLRTNCEEQHRKTMVAYHNCKNVTSNFHTEVLVLDAVTSLSDRRQDLKQLPVVSPCMGSHEYQKTLINSNTRFVPLGSKADEQVLQLPEFKMHQSEENLSQLTRNAATLGNEWDNMAEIMEQSHGTHSLPSSRQPIKDKLVVFPSSSNEKMSAKPKKEMEKSKIQSYLMQHQESILQLQKAGLVRKHTKELERLMFLTSPNSQNFEKRKNIFADSDSLDLTVHEPTVDIQDLTQSYEDMENSVLSEPSYYEFNFMNGLCQKTSTPYINNRNRSGYLTKDRLQQICATLIPSPLTSSLTRSSSSDSLHSIQGQPGLVELRRQEIEARMRQAGLTICSEMKRSHSIAKLASLTMPNEDLSSKEKEAETFIGSSNIKLDESLLLPNIVEKMKWKSSRCEEMGMQPEQTSIMEPLKSIETSSSILEHKTLPYIQRTNQVEHSCQMFSPTKYSISDPEVTQQFEDFTSVPSSGLSQFHIRSANELCPLASKEQNV
ncbi:protein phosphatase Slingshot homolog 1-like isoform X1 [Chiloscyllium plagiosum]|uniref:protein phosphatase Slingshot homolog 1-like isoform X1 n=3 Tax=Chiloscyllium plagiosum TaxID=36176 RepID=UPI001CB888F4|nr:protein phosphatase Slingshot homolog 1-like isoform X1 [Chiloscyllium plagiosum]